MLTYDIQNRGSESLYEHLYRCIRTDIESGAIAPGEHLPSKRAFAKHLGVSLITVEGAYSQLIAEGYVRSEPRRGYYACELPRFEGRVPRSGKREAGYAHVGSSTPLAGKTIGRENEAAPASGGIGRDGGGVAAAAVASAARETYGRRAHAADPGHPGQRANSAADNAYSPGEIASFDGFAGGSRDSAQKRSTKSAPLSAGIAATSVSPSAQKPLLADFSTGAPPYNETVVRLWERSVRSVVADGQMGRAFESARPEGVPHLRASIARYLHGFRGMDVDPGCIVIGAGAQTLYALIVQLLGRDTAFAIEDPGYRLLARMYESNGTQCMPVAMDSEGIDAGALAATGASVAHIMPSHQFPCGTVTSIGRRYQLLAWASEDPDRYLIEDDYDSEFRLAGRPIPSLSSIDAEGKVIYLNTFSKSLGPAMRIAYMVLPPALMSRFHSKLGFYANTVSALSQVALAQLIDSGDYERHVNRYRTRHRARRDALVATLREAWESTAAAGSAERNMGEDGLAVEEADSGLHFILAGPHVHDAHAAAAAERAVTVRALEKGVKLAPLSAYAMDPQDYAALQKHEPNGIRPRFVMQYASVPEESFPEAAAVIAEAIRQEA